MRSGNAARGALVGLLGGLLAAGAMSLMHRMLADGDRGGIPSTPPEDPTVKVAAAATRLVGYRLHEAEKVPAGSVVHYAFGAVVGAVYGAAAEIIPMVSRAFGLPFGAAVWLGAHVVAVPALGLAESPVRRPVAEEAEEFGLHLVYGSVTELVRRLLRA
jgi:putative membrane protein